MFGFGRKKNAPHSSGQKDRPAQTSSSGIKGSLISLEQRLMFDAAASATASEVASEQVAQEQAETAVSSDHHADGPSAEQAESQGVLDAIATYNPGESRSEVVFVDPTVPNYQDLLSSMNSNVEVIMLDGGQDGIEQMANALSQRTGIDAIHLISHGGAGELQLGTGVLNADSMSTQYADDLAVIHQSLSEQADILVYGCEFAQGEAGQAAVDMLANLTGADVQASNDLTGSISLGGDWELEVSTGTIETSLAVDYDAQMNWAEVLGNETVADTFSDKSYGNNDGTRSWSSNWSEVDVGKSDANGGHIQINSGELRIQTQVAGASVSRAVDLSSARSATLSFDYNNDLDKGGTVEVRISTDGGANYRTLSDGTFSKTNHTGSGTACFDISEHMSADTKIQFVVTGTSGGDRLFIDNVHVDYNVVDANTAPSDLSLSASTVAENATTGTVVGTVTGSDVDAGDTKTYSLTDTAGGRFAINSATGQLTVANGSLLNYESAANHTVTVQVTDSGEQSYDEQFTINLTNVNEGPTNLALSANTVAENAVTGTVVGAVTGTDPDASDTKTYSLTDTAGGRFAIDASTGVITVADGSLLNYVATTSHNLTVQVTDSGGQSYTEQFTINLTNVNEGPIATTVADEFSEDMAHRLATADFGIRDSNVFTNASLPGINLSNESEEDRFRLPDNPRNVIDIKTEGPLPIEILTPDHTDPSVVSAPVEKALAEHKAERLPNLGEKREPDAMGYQTDSQNTATAKAEPKEFLKPDDPIENVEESTALKLSATIGLAGVVLQNGLGNNTKLSRLISRPAGASNVSPETTTQQSPVDDRASNQDKLEHPRSAAADADQT